MTDINAVPSDGTAEHEAWRSGRWLELTGPGGKASVVAKAVVSGTEERAIHGVPGRWATNEAGSLTVAATARDGIVVDGVLVDGAAEVPPGKSLTLSDGRAGMVGGADGSYGVVVLDEGAVARSHLAAIDAYPYEPAWLFTGEYRKVPEGRRAMVERLTVPRSTDLMPAPVDLAVVLDGVEHVLTVVEEIPGQGLVIFTDETSGAQTPDIGRWLNLPLDEPGTAVTVDFNRATLSNYHVSPLVFTCPLSPAGNHLPIRVEAGERRLLYTDTPMTGVREEIAATYLQHLQNREWSQARSLATADATVWHSDGTGDSTIDENIEGMKSQIGSIESMRYEIHRQISGDSGLLQQHLIHVVTADGARAVVYAAVYFGFEDGLISRIEEYANAVPVSE